MRTLRLRTVHNCRPLPCPTCSTIENAFRRALGLAGYPLPQKAGKGPRTEAFVSAEVAIELEHACEVGAGVPHFELWVDDVPVKLPAGGSARTLQETLLRIIRDLEPARLNT